MLTEKVCAYLTEGYFSEMNQPTSLVEPSGPDKFATRADRIQIFMYNWAKATAKAEDIKVYNILCEADRAEYLALHRACFEFIMEGRGFIFLNMGRVTTCLKSKRTEPSKGAGHSAPMEEVLAREKPLSAAMWANFELTRYHYAKNGTVEEKKVMQEIRWA